jgi:hypothetical protein
MTAPADHDVTDALIRGLASGRTNAFVGGTRGFRALRDSQRQLQDARATTDAGLVDQLADWSRALPAPRLTR